MGKFIFKATVFQCAEALKTQEHKVHKSTRNEFSLIPCTLV